jgi:hypothetical protein
MTDFLDDPPAQDFTSLLLPAQRLRITMAPCRVRFTWFSSEKSLTLEQKTWAAERFGAAPRSLAATKKLLDTRHPAFRAVTAVRNRIDSDWRATTLPFPEPCIRLIRLDQVEEFNQQMGSFSCELSDVAADLEQRFEELKADAAGRLGSLFEPSDYPATLLGAFAVHWDFPNLEPPSNLAWLSPTLHMIEDYRVQSRFQEAVRLAEEMFLEEFTSRVAHLCERISGTNPDGTAKIFRDAAVDDLGDFIARYRRFDLRPNRQLDELIGLVRRTLQGITPGRLRDHPGLRRTVATQLAWVQASLDAMQEDHPQRPIPGASSRPSTQDG